MSEVKRYRIAFSSIGEAWMDVDPDGSYVEYTDYATLSQQLAAARAEITRLTNILLVNFDYDPHADEAVLGERNKPQEPQC